MLAEQLILALSFSFMIELSDFKESIFACFEDERQRNFLILFTTKLSQQNLI